MKKTPSNQRTYYARNRKRSETGDSTGFAAITGKLMIAANAESRRPSRAQQRIAVERPAGARHAHRVALLRSSNDATPLSLPLA
jgi:hypothetical protein